MNEQPHATVELDADAEAMLAAFRNEEALPRDVESRVWARVEEDAVVAAAPAGPRWVRRIAIASVAAAAAVALVWVSADAISASRQDSVPMAAAHDGGAAASGGVAQPRGHVDPHAATPGQAVLPDPRDPASANGSAADSSAVNAPTIDAPHPASSPGDAPRSTAPAADAPDAASAADPTAKARPSRSGAVPTDGMRARPGTKTPKRAAGDDRPAPASDSSEAPKPASDPTPASRLGEEVALIQRARQALLDGEPANALRALQDHQREFSSGDMTRERKALQAIATCQLHGVERGRAKAQQFLRAHATAALAERVRTECEIK